MRGFEFRGHVILSSEAGVGRTAVARGPCMMSSHVQLRKHRMVVNRAENRGR